MLLKILHNNEECKSLKRGEKNSEEILEIADRVSKEVYEKPHLRFCRVHNNSTKEEILELLKSIFLKNLVLEWGSNTPKKEERIDLLEKYSNILNHSNILNENVAIINNNSTEVEYAIDRELRLLSSYTELSEKAKIFFLATYGPKFLISCFNANTIQRFPLDILYNHSDEDNSEFKIMGVNVKLSHNLTNLYNEAVAQNKRDALAGLISELVRNIIDDPNNYLSGYVVNEDSFTNLKTLISFDLKSFSSKIVNINKDQLKKELKDLYKKAYIHEVPEDTFYNMIKLLFLLRTEKSLLPSALYKMSLCTTLETKNNDDSLQQSRISLFDTIIAELLDSKDRENLLLAASEESLHASKLTKVISVNPAFEYIDNIFNKS